MNSYPVNSNNNNISMKGNPFSWLKSGTKKAGQKIMDKMPEITSKEGANSINRWKKINDFTSHPMWNRAILGVTGLVTIPAIDYYNRRVDDETRTVARNRSIAKGIACMGIGMSVRGPVAWLVKKMTDLNGKTKFSKFLLPKNKEILEDIKKDSQYLSNHRSTLAMIIALAIMMYTNFKCDAPATSKLTNKINKLTGVANDDNGKEVIYG